MKTPRLIEELRQSDNPVLNTIGLGSGVACLAIGVFNTDPLLFSVGAVTSPIMRYIVRVESIKNSTSPTEYLK